jgi:hypothetical protein
MPHTGLAARPAGSVRVGEASNRAAGGCALSALVRGGRGTHAVSRSEGSRRQGHLAAPPTRRYLHLASSRAPETAKAASSYPGRPLQDAKTSRKSALLGSLLNLERALDAIRDRPIGRSQTGGDGRYRVTAISPGDWGHTESLAPRMATRGPGCSRQLGFAGRSQGQGKHGSSVSCVGRPRQAAHSSVTGRTRSVKKEIDISVYAQSTLLLACARRNLRYLLKPRLLGAVLLRTPMSPLPKPSTSRPAQLRAARPSSGSLRGLRT